MQTKRALTSAIIYIVFRFGCYRGLMSIIMILGVLLITRPCAIFGHDYKEKNNEPVSSTVSPYLLPDDIEPGLHAFKLIPINVSNYDEEIQDNTTIGLYAGSMSPVGYFYSELKKHSSHDSYYFTPTKRMIGYIACIAVPLLSALISLVTRQCNNKNVPVYILMFWFGIGASFVIIIGKSIRL